MEEFIGNVAADVAERHEYHLLDTQFSTDHLRLLLSLRPEQTVFRAVQMLKGNLSRQFSLVYPGLLEQYRLKRPLAAGYFARSSGKADLQTVRKYIADQPTHHGYRGEWTAALTYTNPDFRSPAYSYEHSACVLNYQVVLVTKFRTEIFDEHIAPKLFEYILAIGNKRGFAVDRMSLMPDHIHLLIEGRPEKSVAEYALSIVNNTQSWMMKNYWGVLKEMNCWDVWQPSFYAGTIGEYSTAQVRRFLGRG